MFYNQVRRLIFCVAGAVLSSFVLLSPSIAADQVAKSIANPDVVKQIPPIKAPEGSPYDELQSGYNFRTQETQELQDDDFINPAFLWVDSAEENWSVAEGDAGKSCAECHGDAEESMKGVGAKYPIYDEDKKSVVNLELRINQCREEQMKAKPWKYESFELLAMTAYVKHQSRNMPVNVDVSSAGAKAAVAKGKEFYYQRRGQLDMACANCHEAYSGYYIRADHLSQGQSNGFPTYRLKWQGMGSLHRRFRGCNGNIRAKKLGYASEEYLNLEMYLATRGAGLLVETPSVRQ